MKKFAKVFVVICLIFAMLVTVVACDSRLKTPTLSIQGNTLSWNKIKNAIEYEVTVEDKVFITENTSFTIKFSDLGLDETKPTTVKAKVRALGDGEKYEHSNYSKEVEYTNVIKLNVPQVTKREVNGDVILSWNSVEYASHYEVYFSSNSGVTDSEVFTTEDTTYTIGKAKMAKPAIYSFSVKAIGLEGKFIESGMSASVTKYTTEVLAKPTVVYSNTGNLSWNKIDNAKKYIVRLYRGDSENQMFITQALVNGTNYNTSNFENKDSTNYMSEAGVYSFTVEATAESSQIYLDSGESNALIKDTENVAKVTKHEAPQNVKFENNILSWDPIDGVTTYEICFYSHLNSVLRKTVEGTSFNVSEYASLNDEINGGKVFSMTVSVKANEDKTVISGVPSEFAENKYQYYPTNLDKNSEGVYEINTLAKFVFMLNNADEIGAKYILTKDIDAKGAEIYGGTKEMKGIFDGNNKVISNLSIITKTGGNVTSLFKSIGENSVIKNLLLRNIDIYDSGQAEVNIIADINNGLIENVNITGSADITGIFNGICKTNNGTIQGCFIDIDVKGAHSISGLTYTNNGKIISSGVIGAEFKAVASIDQIDIARVAGLAITNKGVITNSFVKGGKFSVETAGRDMTAIASGLVAENSGTISECYVSNSELSSVYSDSSSTSKSYTGGIAGVISGSSVINNCYVYNSTFNARTAVGGIIGSNNNISGVIISNSYATGNKFKSTAEIKGIIIGECNGGTFDNVYYGNYSLEGVGATGEGAKNGIYAVSRSEMKNINIGNAFVMNTKLNNGEFPVLKNMMYTTGAFNSTIAYLNADRTYAEVYCGNEKIDTPSISANISISGTYSYDVFTKAVNDDLKLSLTMIIEVKSK